ncbi:MAG: hypothetical protein E7177_06550 [Erysipelotrichaceae bacterium]|nr:hypothetical protein [Erysipelotrichaceae bacterium]
MRNDLLIYLEQDLDYFLFLRENPYWHKSLSRNVNEFKNFLEDYKTKRRKRLVDKMEDISLMISLAKELM